MGRLIVNVPVKDVECDEIWGFIQKKEGHKAPEEAHGNTIGDAYCFVAIERHTKLVLNFALGRRDTATTQILIEGLRHATSHHRFQITCDAFRPYVPAIADTLGDRVSFAQLIKVYGTTEEGREARYSPSQIVETEAVPVFGDPDPSRICTSIVERQNLTIQNADAPSHPPYEWLFKEVGEPLGRILPAFRVLQLLPDSSVITRDSCDGNWDHRSCMGLSGVLT